MDKAFDYLFQFALAVGLVVLGWLYSSRRDEIAELKKRISAVAKQASEDSNDAANAAGIAWRELEAHKLYAAENFARRDEMKDAMREVEARLAREVRESEARTTKHLEGMLERLEEIRDRLPSKH